MTLYQGEKIMKSAILFTSTGPILIVTSFESFEDPKFLHILAIKGIDKCICFELFTQTVQARYGNHFNIVCDDLQETDDLRVVDIDGPHILSMFDFNEFGPPLFITVPQETTTL
mgnify:CR=1 FL=1